MKNQELVEELLWGLNRTQAELVNGISLEIVIDAIGGAKCEELCLSSVGFTQKKPKGKNLLEMQRLSTKIQSHKTTGSFERIKLVAAIKEALDKQEEDPA